MVEVGVAIFDTDELDLLRKVFKPECDVSLKKDEPFEVSDYSIKIGKGRGGTTKVTEGGKFLVIPEKETKCIFCSFDLDDTQIKKIVMKNENWYKKLIRFNKEKRAKGDKDYLVMNKDSDPFNTDQALRWRVRYFAALVYHFYPPDYTIVNKVKKFSNPFHVRGLYYRLASEGVCLPYPFSKKYFPEEVKKIRKKYGKKRNIILLRKAKLNHLTYKVISELSRWARWGGFIPFEQVIDKRVAKGLTKSKIKLTKNLKKDAEKPIIEIKANLSRDYKPDIKGPTIVIVSEKTQFEHAFEYLRDKYNIAYYTGSGFSSITGALQIYNYIKQQSNMGFVLMISDWDKAGFDITNSLARKIQFYSLYDESKEKPKIFIKKWLLSKKDLEDIKTVFKKRNLDAFQLKSQSGLGQRYIVEADILESFVSNYDVGYGHTKNLGEVLEEKLKELFNYDPESGIEYSNIVGLPAIVSTPLMSNEMIAEINERVEKELKKAIEDLMKNLPKAKNKKINEELNLTENFFEKPDLDQYLDSFNEAIKEFESYKTLEDILSKIEKSSKTENPLWIPIDIEVNSAGSELKKLNRWFKKEVLDDMTGISPRYYKKTTETLLERKKDPERLLEKPKVIPKGKKKKKPKKKKKK